MTKAEIVNIMEDHVETLAVGATESGDATIKLQFRGYEIKTVRLTLDPKAKATTRSSDGWVKL